MTEQEIDRLTQAAKEFVCGLPTGDRPSKGALGRLEKLHFDLSGVMPGGSGNRSQHVGHERFLEVVQSAAAESKASEEDVQFILGAAADAARWQQCRTVILLANSARRGGSFKREDKGDWIQERVIARATELGLTAYALAKATASGVTENAVKDYLERRCTMSTRKLQHLFRALGLTVSVA